MAKKKSSGAAAPLVASSFLAILAQKLEAEPGVDVGLAQILTKHILVASQADDSGQSAKDAIVALASERAKPVVKKGSADDQS